MAVISRLLEKQQQLLSEKKKLDTSPRRKSIIEAYLKGLDRDIERLGGEEGINSAVNAKEFKEQKKEEAKNKQK